MDMLWTIVIVMVASGLLGGIINFFIADTQAEKPLSWWQHIVVGVGAALMVPLFLNMISSGIIDSDSGNKRPVTRSIEAARFGWLLSRCSCILTSVHSHDF